MNLETTDPEPYADVHAQLVMLMRKLDELGEPLAAVYVNEAIEVLRAKYRLA